MEDILAFLIGSFVSLIAIMNPLSTIGVLLSLTKGKTQEERNEIIFKSTTVAFLVLLFFSITGFLVFQIYSITIDAFRIAGGIVLFIIGIRMLFPPQKSKTVLHSLGKEIYLVPIAIPLTSGPGAITTVIVLASQANTILLEVALWLAIILACIVNLFVLRWAETINKVLKGEAISALIKIMGLLVCAVGVQFVINGIKAAFPVLASQP